MKVLVLYASLCGSTHEVANYIANQFEDVTVVDLISQKAPNIVEYDKIIIGSGTYFNKPHKSVIKFINQNMQTLKNKDFSIFFCCGSIEDKKIKKIKDKIETIVQNNTITINWVGGKLNYKKAPFPQKLLLYLFIKIYRMKNKLPLEINYEKVNKFIERVKTISKHKQ